MSDQPQGEGWWLASDGKYYPPESAPAGQPVATTSTETTPPAPPRASKPVYRRWWFWVLVALAILLLIPLFGRGEAGDTASTAPGTGDEAAEGECRPLTEDETRVITGEGQGEGGTDEQNFIGGGDPIVAQAVIAPLNLETPGMGSFTHVVYLTLDSGEAYAFVTSAGDLNEAGLIQCADDATCQAWLWGTDVTPDSPAGQAVARAVSAAPVCP